MTLPRLAYILGINNSWISITTSILLTLIVVTSVYSLASFFNPELYFFERRVTYHTNEVFDIILNYRVVVLVLSSSLVAWLVLSVSPKREMIFLASIIGVLSILTMYLGPQFLYLIPFIALPLIVTLFLLRRIKIPNVLVLDTSSLFCNYLSFALIVLAIISILYSLGIVDGNIGGGSSDYSYLLITIISWFSPVVVFLLVFSFPSKVIWEELRSRLAFISDKYVLNLKPANIPKRLKLLSLGSIIVLSILIAFSPHIFAGSGSPPIGVDTVQYAEIVDTLSDPQKSPDDVFWLLFRDYSDGDRPFTILLVFAIGSLFSSHLNTIESIEYIIPVILAPSLSIVVFLLARQITQNDLLSLICSFLTAISPQILIGIYAGFYANWLALIFAYLSSMFMFGFLRTSNLKYIVLFSLTLVTVIFTHTYTYTIIILVLSIFLLSSLYLKSFSKRVILVVLAAIIFTIFIDLSRSAILGSSSGVTLNLGVAEKTEAGLSQFESRWSNLVRTVQVHVGGIFGNSVFIMGLALAGIIIVSKKPNMVLLSFLISFLSIGILPLFFGDRVVMTRVLYNIPFQIPAALALIWLARQGNVGILASIALLSYSLAISIRLLANFQENVL
jgi:hypothetical protein